ncbi:DUF3291 domain-containing protein [Corallococcus llansteffanensis]|uniref:DUF3291 domain-containing protein n=1 Tax=Corallococcus llansteffanensis TaxID=2316731 RepID=A0A3A8QHW5_9BACT|nr:DUF3291 domain-containing protein [Corallococcus llansteffanensis]RKH68303.1 DUF3291 domain-containing protein [Corallococcus llansteffanensis]
MRVAFTTFAILKKPYGNPEVQEFDDRTPAVFLEAENASGFIARARESSSSELSNFHRDWGHWGKFCVPRFYTLGRENENDQRASTLSVWKDLQSVLAFAYSGLHMEALRKRKEWFLEPAWPSYAMWWVEDDHVPTWQEACERLELLHDQGPTPQVFDFKKCFDAQGNAVDLKGLRDASRRAG